jgi:hypothetical protein
MVVAIFNLSIRDLCGSIKRSYGQRPTSDISDLLILCTEPPPSQKFTIISLEKWIQTATQAQMHPRSGRYLSCFTSSWRRQRSLLRHGSWWRDVTDWLRQFNSANIRHVVFRCTTAQNTIRFTLFHCLCEIFFNFERRLLGFVNYQV